MKYVINGRFIEIYFDSVPDYKLRESLKICGWKWFKPNKCWSNYNNYENLEWVKNLEKELNPKPQSSLLKLRRERIGIADLLVRSNNFYCNKHHEIEDMAAEIEVLDKYKKIHTYLVPIAYCKTCDVYFILEGTYQDLKKKGCIRAGIISYKVYKEYGNKGFAELNEVSPLRAWGYTVSEKEGYSEIQRQGILEDIIYYKVLTKSKVLSYLDFFIRLNNHDSLAVSKWKADREYIAQFNINDVKRIKVGDIIVFDYIYYDKE